MAWDEKGIDDPSLYTPRDTPRVLKADAETVPADPYASPQQDYLFDEDETWDESLDALPAYHRGASRAYIGDAPTEAPNPYAKRRPQPSYAKAQALDDFPKGNSANPIVYAGIITACLAVLAIICVMMMPQMAGYFWKDLDNFAFINGEVLKYNRSLANNYKTYRDYLKQDIIYQGIFVDGVHVGGLTMAEAEATLTNSGSTQANAFSVTVTIGNKSWLIDNASVSATRNVSNVLKQAYAIGRKNTTAIIGTNLTPFRERVETVMNLMDNYVTLKSDATYDHDAVKQKVSEIVKYVTRDPVDSQIQSFDPNTRTFTFTDEQPGVTVDGNTLYAQLTSMLERGAVGETLAVTPTITTPAVTKTDMMNSFQLVAAYTTSTTSDKNRNNNINLACQAINGHVLMPGETFSFNDSTGQRTTNKGYKSAGAIASGQSIEEVGGGICQVSSTLFNAVARADLEIVSRSPHAWPSTYVTIGQDATVNWPSLDFKFKNNKSTPVFVLAYYKDRKCSAEIWGMTLGTGITIDLESVITKTIEPSSETVYKQNPELAAGESKETIKARTGYVVETYKIWYKDGQEMKRELFLNSTYKTYQQTIEYN